MYIRDQFVRGLQNCILQTDILIKANQRKTLTDILKYPNLLKLQFVINLILRTSVQLKLPLLLISLSTNFRIILTRINCLLTAY